MKEKIRLKNKRNEVIFEITEADLNTSISGNKGGDHIYLLEYDYARDFLIINRDADETIEKLKDYFNIIDKKQTSEEIYVLATSVLGADMVVTNVQIEHGSILEFDQNGDLISDLLHSEKEEFSAVDADELAELNLEELSLSSDNKPYVDPAAALVQASEQAGIKGYNRKDVLDKFAEEQKQEPA